MWQVELSNHSAGALCRFADYYGDYTPEAALKVAEDLHLDHNITLASAILQIACAIRDEDLERQTITESMYYGRDE